MVGVFNCCLLAVDVVICLILLMLMIINYGNHGGDHVVGVAVAVVDLFVTTAVHEALHAVLVSHGKLTAGDATAKLKQMQTQKTYVQELWSM